MNDIARTPLGRTGLSVTRLGYGAMELRGPRGSIGRAVDRDEARKLLNGVLDAGINFIDTSPDYGDSEEIIGEAISARRDEFFLASKCGCPVASGATATAAGPAAHDYTRENIRAGVEQSLRRMKTDHLDLVQIHISPSREELERRGSMAELEALRNEGKIRFIGMSGTLPNLPDHLAMGCFDAFQIPYSAIEPEHEDWISRAADAGAGTIIRGGVARGIPQAREASLERLPERFRHVFRQRYDLWQAANLEPLLEGMSKMEFMLRFTLTHAALCTTIVGTANVKHLGDNVTAARKGPLPGDLYAEAKRRIEEAR